MPNVAIAGSNCYHFGFLKTNKMEIIFGIIGGLIIGFIIGYLLCNHVQNKYHNDDWR